MIKSNSPYYITTPFVSVASGLTCQNYELSVSVWNGLKSSPPSTATYTTTKNNPTASTETDRINIARIVNDYIEFTPQKTTSTSVINGNNNQWVKTSVIYNKDIVALPQITSLTVTDRARSSGNVLLTLNGVLHTFPLTGGITGPGAGTNALEIANYINTLTTHTATHFGNIVTITAVQNGLQSLTLIDVSNLASMTVAVLTTQQGSTGQEAPQYSTTNLMSLGYSYGNEGENITTILDNTLIPTQDYKVNREGVFVVPILVSETLQTTATVISYPSNEINQSFTIPSTINSNELVRYIWIKCNETSSDTYIEIVFNGKTTTLLLQDEPKYTPIDIFFQNKEGAEQVLTFFKEQKSNLSVNSSEFESDRGQPSLGNHQFVRHNVQGRTELTLNSGFVDQDMNEIFTQLLLSERIWSYNTNIFSKISLIFIPLNIKSKQLSYKTQLKERLINYEIKFNYSYNEINNI